MVQVFFAHHVADAVKKLKKILPDADGTIALVSFVMCACVHSYGRFNEVYMYNRKINFSKF